jgi:hypothetical protein
VSTTELHGISASAGLFSRNIFCARGQLLGDADNHHTTSAILVTVSRTKGFEGTCCDAIIIVISILDGAGWIFLQNPRQ